MDVQNFQREEQVRKAEQKRRMEDQKRYLDEQVMLRAHADVARGQALSKLAGRGPGAGKCGELVGREGMWGHKENR